MPANTRRPRCGRGRAAGSAILTDLRWAKGPLYVRYGGFTPRVCIGPTGVPEPAIEDPSGTLVPDERGPGGTAVTGDYGTSVGAPPEKLDSAKQFLADYKAAGYQDSHTSYGALAYDSANAIVNAFEAAVGSGGSITDDARRKVIAEVGRTNTTGASGKVAFDSFGDTVTRSLTMYKVEAGVFNPIKTGEFAG